MTAVTPSRAAQNAKRNAQEVTARENPDGTWDIYGVRVMGTVKAGEKGKGAPEVNEKWLRAALAESTQHAERGYSRPLVLRHTYRRDGQVDGSQERAGSFVLREVDDGLSIDGVSPVTLTADFLRISPAAYARIKSGEFPSVSVEVGSYQTPTIAKIALLDTEEPWFRSPNIVVGREITSDEARHMHSYRAADEDAFWLRGYMRVADHHAYLFRAGFRVTEEEDMKLADLSDEDMKAFAKRLAPALKEYMQADDGGGNGGPKPPVTPEEINQMQDTGEKGDEKDGGKPDPMSAQFADMAARLTAMEQFKRESESAKAVDARVASALAELKDYHLDDDDRASIRQFAAAMDDKTFAAYVANLKRHIPQEADTLEDLARQTGAVEVAGEDVPAEVAAYRKDGERQYEAALRCYADWKLLQNTQFQKTTSDLAEHLKFNLPSYGGTVRA